MDILENEIKNQEIKYEERLVAFIDILGFKEIVKQSKNDTSKVKLIYSVLKFLKDWEIPEKWDLKLVEIEEDAQYKGVANFDIRGKTNSTSFSDSIVVSVKINDNINEMASSLIVNLAYIGSYLLEAGILFRGGLTVGDIIHDENGTVFGQGLIEAYQLESNNAKFPRIILSDKLIRKLNYPITTDLDRYPYHQYIERFDDGFVGFHQMQYYQVVQSWEEMTVEKLTTSFDKVRKVIINGLDESFENSEVFKKYKWLNEQYNRLIITDEFIDYKKNIVVKGENIKKKLYKLNENISGQNIHFSYTDDFHEMLRKKKANK